ncbi:MAG: Phosphate transport system regulatory protein PhoU [uncultured Sulfurovum sp.]|uniref:Phosphate transport system regulatory protein PhoU n=1 Tax=uncultured Sulfurovum sp. TaxID=269237 RepID=A0A6S6T1P8_9BACT|nr:MAG: Phosphate transport system regulatory protein PhoU [uncultured Sulfurovum sp.]
MLSKNAERLEEVRERTIEILEDLTISQKLALQALEECDSKSFEQVKVPLKTINKKANEIDNLILTVCALYSPEAGDLRELIAFLKITSALQRIATNEKNYMKNMAICNPESDDEIKRVIKESLSINRCTIKALEYTIEMIHETEDEDKLNELAARINVEYSKTDDIYSMIEKDLLQKMHKDHQVNEDYINLMKYIRKNLKIIDRLEDIVSRLIFARIGGKL